jgi:hypothetical protein
MIVGIDVGTGKDQSVETKFRVRPNDKVEIEYINPKPPKEVEEWLKKRWEKIRILALNGSIKSEK